MKKIFTICAAFCITASIFAQAPEKMSYQAVIRDGSNALVASSSVGMQISILQGSLSGTAVYVETQTPTSNTNGLVSLEIGNGTTISGNFTTIDWANGPYFIKTETDPTGGTNYTITGTSQLLSVPYALHAKNSDGWTTLNDSTYSTNNIGIGTNSPNYQLQLENTLGDFSFKLGTPTDSTYMRMNHKGWVISDTINSSTLSFQYSEPGSPSTMTINNEPTYTYFIPTGQGPNRHITYRINGQKRFTISGTGVININSVLNMTPRTSAPPTPSKGDIYMDDTTNKLMVYDGTQWQACW
jgi:hypothetical protein